MAETAIKSSHSDTSDASHETYSSNDTTGPLLRPIYSPNTTHPEVNGNSKTGHMEIYRKDCESRQRPERKSRLKIKYRIIVAVGLITFLLGAGMLAASVVLLKTSKCPNAGAPPTSASDLQRHNSSERFWESANESGWMDRSQEGINTEGDYTLAVRTTSTTTPSTTTMTMSFDGLLNLAEGMPANQSSTVDHTDSWYPPSNAVDGKMDRFISSGSCSQTDYEYRPFWMVDLQKLRILRTIRIITASDCCAEDLDSFEVRIGQQTNPDYNILCQQVRHPVIVNQQLVIRCHNQIYGRFVSIRRLDSSTKQRLTVCEVMVYTE